MQKISGNEVSQKILERLNGVGLRRRGFTAVLVGDDPISLNFLKKKREIAEGLGLEFKLVRLPGAASEAKVCEAVAEAAGESECGGVIVQLPLPGGMERHKVLDLVPAEKDVDVLGKGALEAFHDNKGKVLPPPVGVVEELVRLMGVDLEKSKVAVLGLGLLIGKPIADWLAGKCRELVTLKKGSDLLVLRDADLVVSGAGRAGLLRPEMLKEGAGVIDFGYDYAGGELSGDLDVSDPEALKKLSFYTPTPGGTGPILIAKLFENFYKLNSR